MDTNIGGMTENKAEKIIHLLCEQNFMPPQEPYIDEYTWEIKKGNNGRKINPDKTMERILNASEGQHIDIIFEEIRCGSEEELNKKIIEEASYTTKIINRDEDRVNNIKIAAEMLDYWKIKPGEEFSFNEALGKRTTEKGYSAAPIIIQTPEGPQGAYGIGGGICQVSSTLYNAAIIAGAEIIERHPHSKKVNYVPEGHDATVVYNGADLKFKNSGSYTIMIRTYMENESLTVKIYKNLMK